MKDDLCWKMTFAGRRTRLKTTFGGRQSSVEDNLRWKMTFAGRRPSVEDDFWSKMTFGGRRPSVEDNLQWILACCLLRLAAFFNFVWFCLNLCDFVLICLTLFNLRSYAQLLCLLSYSGCVSSSSWGTPHKTAPTTSNHHTHNQQQPTYNNTLYKLLEHALPDLFHELL